ncbi:MAG: hemolysin III family protein [Clostridia bacterium]|nr:hemolysin III family protein [Clostridia bacterium]
MENQNILASQADFYTKEEKKQLKAKLRAENQPKYTLGEDLFNSISHGLGALFGIFALIFGCITVSYNPAGYKYAAIIIYALSITILYVMSCLYHAFPQGKAKRVFRIFDHCTIFLLIAGTYAPYCLITFHGTVLGYVLFGIQWGVAAVGITFNAINMYWKAVKIISMAGYFVMGWCVIFALPMLLKLLNVTSLIFLLLGGVVYTLGIIFYGVGSKKKYFHSIWHIFVLAGTVLQFISVYFIL